MDDLVDSTWFQEVQLNVTECRAEGEGATGLNCHGEGFFVNGFEENALLVCITNDRSHTKGCDVDVTGGFEGGWTLLDSGRSIELLPSRHSPNWEAY